MQLHYRMVKECRFRRGFTLTEMLVVVAIMAILMTIGVMGLNGIQGKGVTAAVSSAESIFEEAKTTSIGKGCRTCVLVSKQLADNPSEDLRRLLVAHEELIIDPNDPNVGKAKDPTNPNPNWVISTRAILLPDQTYFSQKFSRLNQQSGGTLPEVDSSKLKTADGKNVKPAYAGTYFAYRFNSQGICENPGTSFVVGTGARDLSRSGASELPKVTHGARKDFGGFVVWKAGGTSLFRSPDQIAPEVKSIQTGARF